MKKLLWITKWAWPFGGGEETFFDLMMWGLKNTEYIIYWICFEDQISIFDKLKIIKMGDNGKILKVPGGYSKQNIEAWVKLINPDLIHHQGPLKLDCLEICEKYRIPFLSAYHFWTDLIDLMPKYGNIDILNSSSFHKVNSNVEYYINSKYCNIYLCSEFMKNVLKIISQNKYIISNICQPISNPEKYKITNNNYKYVTLINIHKLKGGEILLYLIEKLKDVYFLAIRTENGSEDLDKKIQKAIELRNDECKYTERINDVKMIYSETSILLIPSIVDETYCRVIIEALNNKIPIITTGTGNISNLINNKCSIILPKDPSYWIEPVHKLYTNKDIYNIYSEEAYKQAQIIPSFEQACKKVYDIIDDIIKKEPEEMIMIFAPFATQGLGIQTLNYVNILEKNNIKTCIFSPHCYWTIEKENKYQKDNNEWYHPRIYYSPNDREHILDEEIITFIEKYNVTKCIIPETCWFRVFQIAALLKSYNIKVYAIPNIETVRKDEIWKHRIFHQILCNNQLCYDIFTQYNFQNTLLIKYSIPSNIPIHLSPLQAHDTIKYMVLGGNNAFSRKKIHKILKAFVIALNSKKDISLTITLQCCNVQQMNFLNDYKKYPQITIIKDILSNSDITNIYKTHHVNIQCSSQEGLGIGFYESLAFGIPCISLNTPPHNEIIINNICGILLNDIKKKPLKDNNNGLINRVSFHIPELSNLFLNLSFDKINALTISCINYYNSHFNYNNFSHTFINSILN